MAKCILTRKSKKKYFTSFFAIFIFLQISAQVPAFDRMEQFYDQGHYKIVIRKALRCLDNPEYDYSFLPKYYLSIAAFQLMQDDVWRKKHPKQVEDAFYFLSEVVKSDKGRKTVVAHQSELRALEKDIASWLSDLNLKKEKELSFHYESRFGPLFRSLLNDESEITMVSWEKPSDVSLKSKTELIEFAVNYIGTPYLWAGESPDGFDCSGFTSYVFKHFNKNIPRRSVDQFENSTKIESSEAHIGDLVFFGTNHQVTHVGILVNEPGKPKRMIHSSTSKGVRFEEIESSDYYSSRLIGFGRY